MFDRGVALHQAGRLDEAGALYAQALARDPGHGPSLHMAGMLAFQQDQPELCLARLQQALAAGYRTAALFDHAGVVRQRLSDLAGAVASFRAGLALDPEAGGLWFNLGLAERQSGRLDAAIDAFAEAAARLRQAFAEHMLGLAQQEAGRAADAAASYHRALALDPAHGECALNAGVLAHQAGDLPGAIALYRQAMASMPGSVAARTNLAAALQEGGAPDEAAAELRAILAVAPDSVEALNNLGVLQRSAGAADAAEALFRRALAADPFHAAASDNLASLLQDTGRRGEAVAARRQVCAAHPGDARAWMDLGRILGLEEGGEGALHQALALDPGLAEAHGRLGDCAQARRDWPAASAHYRDAARCAPWRKEPLLGQALAGLKAGDSAAALAACDAVLMRDRFDQCAVAYRALALRQCGDRAQADWLTAPDALVTEIAMDVGTLPELAAALQAVRNRAFAPAGQSVRGGTQTQDELFVEAAPQIQAFRQALDAALAHYLAVRPRDGGHPFLAARPEELRYHSWSVILAGGGYHAPHIHPGGCISGVFYAAVPSLEGGGAGCLEVGRPGISLPLPQPPPIRLITPRPGLLVLFPSYLWHGTRRFTGPGERITIAFDVRYGSAPLPSARW